MTLFTITVCFFLRHLFTSWFAFVMSFSSHYFSIVHQFYLSKCQFLTLFNVTICLFCDAISIDYLQLSHFWSICLIWLFLIPTFVLSEIVFFIKLYDINIHIFSCLFQIIIYIFFNVSSFPLATLCYITMILMYTLINTSISSIFQKLLDFY